MLENCENMVEVLDDLNIIDYAMRNYDNPQCKSLEEFEEDFNRIRYVKRLLKRYDRDGNLRERLIINHLIILSNVFSQIPASRMLFFKIEPELQIYLKTFMSFLEILPEHIQEANLDDIPIDPKLSKILRNI